MLRAVHQIQLGQQIPRQNVRDRGIQMLANLRIFRIQRAHVRLRGLVVGVHRGRRVLAGEQTQHIEDRVVNMLARDARIRMVDGPRPQTRCRPSATVLTSARRFAPPTVSSSGW